MASLYNEAIASFRHSANLKYTKEQMRSLLRSRGFTVDNLPKTLLGLSQAGTQRVKDFSGLNGTSQVYTTQICLESVV